MTVKLDNTVVIHTNDKHFKKAIGAFLSTHCDTKKVNVACYDLNARGAEKVKQVTLEDVSVHLDNTFVVRTDDEDFKDAVDGFLSVHCQEKGVSAATYCVDESKAEKVYEIIFEE